MHTPFPPTALLLGAATALLASLLPSLTAQAPCGYAWQMGPAAAGPDQPAVDVLRRSNGEIVIGGPFRVADASICNGIARWNGVTWLPLGGGVATGSVFALAELPNGDLVVGGQFTAVGGVAATNLARWNGSAWSSIGAVTSTGAAVVQAMTLAANGDLVVVGTFTSVGGVPANNVARWDGSTWSPLGAGLIGAPRHVERMQNGDLVVASFTGGLLRRWNGSAWLPITIPGLFQSPLFSAIAALPNGDLAIAGSLQNGVRFGIWDGSILHPDNPPVVNVSALAVAQNGDLFASGPLVGSPVDLARFDGTSWSVPPASGLASIRALAVEPAGSLVVAGSGVARLVGQGWTRLTAVATPPVLWAAQVMPNGDVVLGGDFDSLGGVPVHNIARWNGSTFVPLGSGCDDTVTALGLATNGDLLVGGMFSTAGGAPAQRVARWSGSSWSTLGNGIPSAPAGIASNAVGEIVVAGGGTQPFASVFTASGWGALSPSPVFPTAVAREPGGDVLIGGGNGALRYAAGLLTTVAAPSHSIREFVPAPDGQVIAVGSFPSFGTPAGQLAMFTNGTWQPFGPTPWPAGFNVLNTATFLPDGDLVVAGAIPSVAGQPATGLARLEGGTWSAIPGLVGNSALVMAASARGTLFVGGGFATAGNFVSVGLARAEPTCPAAVVAYGAGCVGGAGTVSLAATTLPWTGAAFRANAQGMTANALALHAVGLQAVVAPLPLGAPGCALFVDPLFVDVLVPSNGQVTTTLLLPGTPSAAGMVVDTQVLGVEFDAAGGIVRITGSNALALTLGAL